MTDEQRRIGGQSNKKGNRYEDHFAICRCNELAPEVCLRGSQVKIREQAPCPVDDLVIRENSLIHYAQLKDHETITWGADERKLEKEFVAQHEASTSAGETFTLTVVVSHEHRRKSLQDGMPESLSDKVVVRLFRAVGRPSDLISEPSIETNLEDLCALTCENRSARLAILKSIALAWYDRELDADETADLGKILDSVRNQSGVYLRRVLPAVIHHQWSIFLEIVNRIDGLSVQFDRGFFEWSTSEMESGFILHPCDSEPFQRFVDRIIGAQPKTLEDFWLDT